jgi:hypothetical protein
MNVVNLGVLAGLDGIAFILVMLLLLGAAMLALLALARISARYFVAVALPSMLATSRTRFGMAADVPELARASGATRAPPDIPPRRRVRT